MTIDIIGTITLLGEVQWPAGTKAGGKAIAKKSETFKGMAPIPVPPPNTGDACPCVAPTGNEVECQMTPGTHTIGGTGDSNKMIVMGSMFTQKDGGKSKVCQPMIGTAASTVLNPLPVITKDASGLAMIIGFLNGAGATP